MITWIQNILQKHHKWLFSLLLIVIVVAFVFTIGNMPVGSGDTTSQGTADFYGIDLKSQKDVARIAKGVSITTRLDERRFYRDEEQSRQLLERAVLLHLSDALQIPQPNQNELLNYMQTREAFTDVSGNYSANRFTEYMDSVKLNPNLEDVDVWNTASENYRIEKAKAALQGPGFVSADEVILDLQARQTKWSVDVATYNYDDFEYEGEISDEDAMAYYESNGFKYEIPEKLEMSYVFVSSERFINETEQPTDEAISAHYESNKSRFPGTTTVEEAKDDVIKALRLEAAKPLAEKFATDSFAIPLYRKKIENGSNEFNALLKELDLETVKIEPYNRTAIPPVKEIPRFALSRAFDMTRYYSDPIAVSDGAAVLIKDGSVPATIPPFENVKGQVIDDLKEERRRAAFSDKGKELAAQLNENVEKLGTFNDSAADAKLELQPFRDFSMMEPPGGLDRGILGTLPSLEKGKVSDMITSGNKGYFVYLADKNIPEFDPLSDEVKSETEMLKSRTADLTVMGIIDEMIELGLASSESEEG